MRSERYFLPPLELTDDELAALQTCLYLLEGKFAYAEPLRLALQNLALGRPGFSEAPTDTAMRVEVLDPEYSTEMQGRLSKLEAAISKQRTVKFPYWSISRDDERERTINPYALFQDAGAWYVVGQDLEAEAERTFRVSRIRGEIRFATRRERDFRLPASSMSTATAAARPGRSAISSARRGSRSEATPPGGCSGRTATPAASRKASSSPSTRACRCSPRGCCARTDAPRHRPRTSSAARLHARSGWCATGTRSSPAGSRRVRRRGRGDRRAACSPGPSGALRRLQALLASPPRPLRREPGRGDPGCRPRRALRHPARGAEEHLSLLDL